MPKAIKLIHGKCLQYLCSFQNRKKHDTLREDQEIISSKIVFQSKLRGLRSGEGPIGDVAGQVAWSVHV